MPSVPSTRSPSPNASGIAPLVSSHRRKAHTKSRTGCVECKRRRVKCNEERPTCKACHRHGVSCVYFEQPLPRGRATVVGSTSHTSSIHPVTSTDNGQPAPSPVESHLNTGSHGPSPATVSPFSTTTSASHGDAPSFTLHDLGLLHHWTVSTSSLLITHPKFAPIWQITVPEIATQHEFLMHGILCLSALHLAHEKKLTKSSFVREAAAHHTLAIQGFNQAISEMDEANSEALFAFASLNIICTFSLTRQLGEEAAGTSRRSMKDRILGLEWVSMIRGVSIVLEPVHRIIWSSPLRVMLDVGNWEELDPDDAAGDSARHLREIRSAWRGSSDAGAYDKILRALIKCFMFVEQFDSFDEQVLEAFGHNQVSSGPIMFILVAPDFFFMQLRQRQPPALIMFAYFGVILHRLRSFWFIEGWGKDIVDLVDDLLGDYWRPWTSWPLEMVETADESHR
ncbi:hypothetical protein BN1708_001374 [Verticillium longisporum]|uniref:Zn(2)-C6 fungal-type domain-containing protein n=1 Tax=Verticillium longisporum TaxID=100787 RepID=A0A0G4MSW9_VERLO|nr:hypothetical protein BN1708_001374 [Verticillium longisporum]